LTNTTNTSVTTGISNRDYFLANLFNIPVTSAAGTYFINVTLQFPSYSTTNNYYFGFGYNSIISTTAGSSVVGNQTLSNSNTTTLQLTSNYRQAFFNWQAGTSTTLTFNAVHTPGYTGGTVYYQLWFASNNTITLSNVTMSGSVIQIRQ
jgi:hypothetical protein